MYKVKTDLSLFERSKRIQSVTRVLSSIVQNDMEISGNDLIEFNRIVDSLINDIQQYREDVNKYIKGGNL